MSIDYDAAVIGGGVAGCCAAIMLAQRGHHVILLEKNSYPHHKVCGEFLSPECIPLFDELGVLPRLQALHPASINNACISAPNGTVWTTSLPGTAMSMSRYALDATLASYAESLGVDLRIQTAITTVEGSLGDFRLDLNTETSPIHTRTVIGAYGKRSNLDRQLARSFFDGRQPFVALKAHFKGSPLPQRIELHVFPGGYCGLSEIENEVVNVCLLVRQAIFRQHESIGAFINWMRQQNALLGAWMDGAEPVFDSWLSIAQIPFARKSVVERDILMTGDAAGVLAPLAGSGMGMALQGGQLAACYIDAFLTKKLSAQEVTRQYAANWRRTFAARLRTGLFLQHIMLYAPLINVGLRAVNSIPMLGQFVVEQTRDTTLSKHRIPL